MPNQAPRVYLAGPDVFDPQAASVFTRLCAQARRLGLEPVPPVDAEPHVRAAASPRDASMRIFNANVKLLTTVDAVVANLRDFRGNEPDSGTVFEVGFAVAKGLPVVGYGVPAGCYAHRVASAVPCERGKDGQLREAGNQFLVEDFGNPLNLMLACSVELAPDAEESLRKVAQLLGAGGVHEEGR